jgi:hypothetical protein
MPAEATSPVSRSTFSADQRRLLELGLHVIKVSPNLSQHTAIFLECFLETAPARRAYSLDVNPDLAEVGPMSRRIFLLSALTLAALGVTTGGYAAVASDSPRMGPEMKIARPAFEGYYDGHKDTYLSTDVSSKAQAKMMNINYAAVLKSVPLKSSPEIYLVQGKAAAGQLAVFGSEPGETSYSPVWKETILSWKTSATPVLIKSDTQINQLEKKGGLTEHSTSVRLNCPIVKVGKG